MKARSLIKDMWTRSRSQYNALPTDEVEEEFELRKSQSHWRQYRGAICFTIVNLSIAVITVITLLCARKSECITFDDSRYQNTLNADLKRVSAYSPILDQLDLTPSLKVLNGLFHDNDTIFMQDPSPEVDKAWELYSMDIFLTDEDTILKSGRNPSEYIQGPPAEETGTDTYIVQWDVFHQIHCLNWLRKGANFEYYYGTKEPGQVWKDHQKHCLHMLLQVITCHADLDPIPYQWMEKHPGAIDSAGFGNLEDLEKQVSPQPDFMVHKMCRNFDALLEWAEVNRAQDPKALRRQLHLSEGVKVWRWNEL